MVAQSLQGPWLNFEEVTHKTGLVKNEILYAIQTQQITPVIYTNNRPFLAYSQNPQGQVIGHAHFQYSGTLAIHPEAIQEIVVSDQTILSREPVKILCPEQIKACSSDYSFRGSMPNGLLDSWEPNNQLFNDDVTIIMHPYEYCDYDDAESGLVEYIPGYYDDEAFFADHGERYFVRSPSARYVCGSNYSHIYDQKALRFPVAAIERLLNPKKSQPVINSTSRLRHHDINDIFERLMKAHPKAQSGELWNTLRRDIQTDKRIYDCDSIITTIDQLMIHWVSAKGVERQLKKPSFQTAISRLRRRIA